MIKCSTRSYDLSATLKVMYDVVMLTIPRAV